MAKVTNIKVAGALAAGSALALAGSGVALAAQPAQGAPQQAAPQAQEQATVAASPVVESDVVQGAFAFTQSEVSPTAQIARQFGSGSYALCTNNIRLASSEGGAASAQYWQIAVTGDVASGYAITNAQIDEDSDAEQVIGCSCAGNPGAGLASVNAQVKGVSVRSIVAAAQPADGANTITFVSADGYEVSVPLWYVYTRPALVATQVNGQPLAEVEGSSNQVWIGSTAASYFVRDITEIRVSHQDVEPAVPGDDASYATPNVAVTGAAEA